MLTAAPKTESAICAYCNLSVTVWWLHSVTVTCRRPTGLPRGEIGLFLPSTRHRLGRLAPRFAPQQQQKRSRYSSQKWGGDRLSGSSTLVSWLLRQGLLDQLDLLVFPVVLGAGKRLFSEPDGEAPLRLAGSEAFGTGVVHLTYVPST
jgi:RibD C-terminal domain